MQSTFIHLTMNTAQNVDILIIIIGNELVFDKNKLLYLICTVCSKPVMFHKSSREYNFSMHSGNFLLSASKQVPDVYCYLPAIFGQEFWLKLVTQLVVIC